MARNKNEILSELKLRVAESKMLNDTLLNMFNAKDEPNSFVCDEIRKDISAKLKEIGELKEELDGLDKVEYNYYSNLNKENNIYDSIIKQNTSDESQTTVPTVEFEVAHAVITAKDGTEIPVNKPIKITVPLLFWKKSSIN
jgi:hypothetical protein